MKGKLRLLRLLSSKLVLLSILSVLGLFELRLWIDEYSDPSTSPPSSPSIHLNQYNGTEEDRLFSPSYVESHQKAPKVRPSKKKLILLAYARSGSSFAGDLLSAGSRTAYYYEPLFNLRPNGTAIENLIARDPNQSGLVKKHLEGIFRCSWQCCQTELYY